MNRALQFSHFTKRSNIIDKRYLVEVSNYTIKGLLAFPMYEELEIKFINKKRAAGYCAAILRDYYIEDNVNMEKKYGPRYDNVSYTPIFVNEKFNQTSLPTWGYDINAAYPSVLIAYIPDINAPLGRGILKAGEVGFIHDITTGKLELVEKEGSLAEERYNLINSPFRKRMLHFYKRRKEVDKDTADAIKLGMNMAIGVLRNRSPHLWWYIIKKAQDQVFKYFDPETTSMINTDCIYSTVPRPDIPIGESIGMFKELPQNGMRMDIEGVSHVWENGEGSISGVPKELQATYNIHTKQQTKKPKYRLVGGFIEDDGRVNFNAESR